MLEAKIGACFIYKKAGEDKPYLIIKIGKGLTDNLAVDYESCKIDPQFVHFIDQTVNHIFALPFEVSPLIATENLERVLANLVKPLIEPTESADGIKPPEFDFNLAFPNNAAPCKQLFVMGAQSTQNHCIGRTIQAELERRIQNKLTKLFPNDTLTEKAQEVLEAVKKFEQDSVPVVRKASFTSATRSIETVLFEEFKSQYLADKLRFLINVITYIRNSEKGIYTHINHLNNRKVFQRKNFLINCIKLALIEEAFYAQKKSFYSDETTSTLSGVSNQPIAAKIEITPETLLNAISQDDLEQVVTCLEYIEPLDRNTINSFLSTTNADGENALLLAARAGLTALVDVLILLGADLTVADKKGKTTLVHLLENKEEVSAFRVLDKLPTLTENERAALLSTITVDHLKTAQQRERIGELLTYRINPDLEEKSGHQPKAFRQAVPRYYRSRKDGRVIQILHHFSTKIHNACYKRLLDGRDRRELIEAQALYLTIDGKDFLFFAMNNISLNPLLSDMVKLIDLKKALIVKDENISNPEGLARNERYAKKLKARVFNEGMNRLPAEDKDDLDRAIKLAALIKKGKVNKLAVTSCAFGQFTKSTEDNIRATLANAGGIFFLDVQDEVANSDPHAEEFLAAIVRIAKQMSENVHSEIAGKRRPCRTCKATLFASKVDQFEKTPPGSLWIGRLSLQSPEEALLTVKSLLTEPTGWSMNQYGEENGGAGYGSGSDSEAEETPKKRYSGGR